MDRLSGLLTNRAKRKEWSAWFQAGFLGELALRGIEGIFFAIEFPFRNGPDSLITITEKRPSRMDQQHLKPLGSSLEHHKSSTDLRHAPIIVLARANRFHHLRRGQRADIHCLRAGQERLAQRQAAATHSGINPAYAGAAWRIPWRDRRTTIASPQVLQAAVHPGSLVHCVAPRCRLDVLVLSALKDPAELLRHKVIVM